MEIHVVQPGESLYRIAAHYGVPPAALLRENERADPNRLTPGECLLVPEKGRTHTIRRGETLASVARQEGTDERTLLRHNPYLAGQERLTPGQTIALGGKARRLAVLGGVPRNADVRTLRRVLPYLDYLAVQTFGFDRTGRVRAAHAEIPVRLAHRYGAKAVFVLTAQDGDGLLSSEAAHRVTADEDLRETLARSAAQNAEAGEWDGVLLDLAYLPGEDRAALSALVREMKARLGEKQLLVALPGTESPAHDLRALGEAADLCVLANASAAHAKPGPAADIGALCCAVKKAVREIPPGKLLCGLASGGWQWALPWREGQQARPLGGAAAAEQAVLAGAPIRFDERSQTAHYNFWRGGTEQEVWFEDARSYRSKCALAAEFRLGGVAVMDAVHRNSALWAAVR